MKVEFYKTLWGMGGSLEDRLSKVKAAGYEGFEDWVQPHGTLRPVIDKVGIKYMAMVQGSNPEQFARDLGEAYDNGAVGATIHAGSHWMTYDQGLDLLGKLVEATKQVPFPVNFETHRGRLLFDPLSTVRYLNDLPGLHLCADISHWTVVTESMLDGFKASMPLVWSRTRHIHARVGFEEGPQVPDPRIDQWGGHVAKFEVWWDAIKSTADAEGRAMTVDPEFGPPNYMWTNPADGQPLSDLWDVALWMTERLRKRWNS